MVLQPSSTGRMGNPDDDNARLSECSGSLDIDVGIDNPVDIDEEENVSERPPKDEDTDTAVSVPEESGELVCGVGPLRPRSLQWVAGGPKAFAFWCMLYFLLKTTGSLYFGSAITTIEKQFKLSSTESGALAILNDAMDLALVLFVAYFGQKSHRPRIIGVGLVIAGIGLIMCAIPHLWLEPYTSIPQGCNETDSYVDYCSADRVEEPCSVDFKQPAVKPVAWLIIGQIMLGIGNVPVKPLSTTYIDDAVGAHTTPVYIAFLFVAGSGGSLTGLLLGSFTDSIFVDFDRVPVEDRPSFSQEDPRYIGAWWLGFVIIGCAVVLSSTPFFLFPRHLPKTKERMKEEKENAEKEVDDKDCNGIEMSRIPDSNANAKSEPEKQEFKEKPPIYRKLLSVLKKMFFSYRRMLTNVSLILLCLSTAASAAITSGNATFALKYLKIELDITTSEAAQLAIIVIPFLIVGNLVGGIIIRRLKLSPAQCTLILVFGEVVGVLCVPPFLTIGCSTKAVAGVSTPYVAPAPFDELPGMTEPITVPDSVQQAKSACNMNCTCGNEAYNPVCGADGITYASPCYAGCEVVERSRDQENKIVNSFSDCRCVDAKGGNATATDGECPGDCQYWQVVVIVAVSIVQFFSGSLGSTALALITLRIVDEDMRATALGFQTLVLNLLGYFLAPVYFGEAINTACILWEYTDSDRGSCWIYDNSLYRYAFQGLIGGIKVVSIVLLFGVYYTLRKPKGEKPTDDDSEEKAEPIT